MSELTEGWYCPSCQEFKLTDKVTFDYTCLDCYDHVHWHKEEPRTDETEV